MRYVRGYALSLVFAALMLMQALPARASTFDWSFVGTAESVGILSGNGTFVGDLVSGNTYNLTGITGSVTLNGTPYTITTLNAAYGLDSSGPLNLLVYPSTGLLSVSGISFNTTAGVLFNLFNWDAYHYGLAESMTNPAGNTAGPLRNIDFVVAATPLPAALLLFLSGLGLLGWLGRRRRGEGVFAVQGA